MKALLPISVFLLIGFFAEAQSKSPKGKIKSTIAYEYDPSQNITSDTSKDWVLSTESHYDTAGHKIWEYERYRSSGDTTYFTYDKEGRMLKMYDKRNVYSNYSYHTDKQDRLIITDHREKYTAVIKTSDKKTGVDTAFLYTNLGELEFKRIYKYNADRTICNITEVKGAAPVRAQTIETYDDHKRKIDEVIIKDGVRESHETIKYDKYGYTRVDSNKMYVGGPPAKMVSDKITSFTYKYDKLDKYDIPLITRLLYKDKYVIVGTLKIEYYNE